MRSYYIRERGRLKKRIVDYLIKNNGDEKIIDFLQQNNCDYVYPYDFIKKYDYKTIEVFREDEFPYAIWNGKRLFGKRNFSDDDWRKVVNAIKVEQDFMSPHRYLFDNRMPKDGTFFADIGAAEGFLALDFIDYCDKLYLFECDKEWVDALEKTFAPWKEKVEIVNKYVSDVNGDNSITLDTFFDGKRIDYIKADIEGFEERMLLGAKNVLSNELKRILLCCYHRNESEDFFKSNLKKNGFRYVEVNEGYVLWSWAEEVTGVPLTPPYLRHGVLYASK